MDRRHFLSVTSLMGAGWVLSPEINRDHYEDSKSGYSLPERAQKLLDAASKPAIKQDVLPLNPVILESVELLKHGRQFLVRVRNNEGAEGIAVSNHLILRYSQSLFVETIAPFFESTDARLVEKTIDDLYRSSYLTPSTYKWQGIQFWSCIASIELAILDLLGKLVEKNITHILGNGRIQEEIGVYRASGNRGNAPEEEVDFFREQVEAIGAKAIKYRLGARMHYTDDSTKRDRALIPLMRESFPDLTLYSDANGSYDIQTAIEMGRLQEEYEYAFFEEPCPFDHYDETRKVTKALDMIVAGGEQEFSMRQFIWQMDHNVIDLVQPDIFYFGGLSRSIRIARAAESIGMTCTPHISGAGLGFLYAVLMAACIPNAGPYHEYKGVDQDLPAESPGISFIPQNGIIRVPSEAGIGVQIDPDFVSAAQHIVK